MEDSYEYDKNGHTSSTSALPAAAVLSSSSTPPDEISLFLQQILLRTSSATAHGGKQQHCSLLSSSPSIFPELTCSIRAFTTENIHPSCGANVVRDAISAVDSSEVVNSSSSHVLHDPSGSCLKPSAANASSSSVGVSENENDEFDLESEEGLEALVEELPSKRNTRSSFKRSRAAEVHNLSEKSAEQRRRSRINEKMKALQNLIPNSNKTDKASMLDEAIEYLKQLQLQVQMLSMRNGLNLHPMSLPGSFQYLQLSHMRMNFGEENRSLPTDQERPTQYFFSVPDQRAASNHPLMPAIERINAETSFELEPLIQAHLVPFHTSEPSKEICGEDLLREHRASMNLSKKMTPFEFEMVGSTAAISPLHFNMAAAELQNGGPVEPCIIEGNQSALKQEELGMTDYC